MTFEPQVFLPVPDIIYGILHVPTGHLRRGKSSAWDFFPSKHHARPRLWYTPTKAAAQHSIQYHAPAAYRDNYRVVKFELKSYQET